MPQQDSARKATKSEVQKVTKQDFLSLANFLEGKESVQRVHKKEPLSEALRTAGEMLEKREYVSAYEHFKPVYDQTVSAMQRILARNDEFEASKLVREQRKSLAIAKENVRSRKAHAQQVIDQFDKLLEDLVSKPLVRFHLKKRQGSGVSPPSEEVPPTTLNSASETALNADTFAPTEIISGDQRYGKTPYTPPEIGALYCVRDRSKGERVIRVIGKSPDGRLVQVETLDDGKSSQQPIELTVDSLAQQAVKGWCSSLLPVREDLAVPMAAIQPATSDTRANVTMRLDIQNFGRCCAAIARANINFDTQLIKDMGDGPFRAGNFEQAFLTFEQFAVGFGSAVANSRRAIADSRRALSSEKGKLSGKEIQERTTAFVRSEQLIHSAEREFSTILEGLRMYLRTQKA